MTGELVASPKLNPIGTEPDIPPPAASLLMNEIEIGTVIEIKIGYFVIVLKSLLIASSLVV